MRVAVVGAGGWGEHHARIFSRRQDTELCGIFGRTPDRTRALTARFNEWMTRHRRTIVVVVAGAVGTYLLVSGLSGLG